MDWFSPYLEEQFPVCLTKEDILLYGDQLALVFSMSPFDLLNQTGCHVRCRARFFSFTDCKAVEVTWKHNWSSAFYLAPEDSEMRTEEEFLVFDLSDTINGIGGAFPWLVCTLPHSSVGIYGEDSLQMLESRKLN